MLVVGRWSSEEVATAIQNMREWIEGVEEIPMSEAVLQRASETFSVPLHTLDAVHLASALLWSNRERQPLHVLTHDRQLGLAARASGLEASGFLERG